MITRAKFDKARTAVLAAMAACDAFRLDLERHYGGTTQWATPGEKARLARLCAAYDRQAARVFKLLEASPRVWDRGVPSYWVAERLTYEDAIRPVTEPLSVDPPRAWGY